jgi:iron only hydrogenase large subunit-like protein
MPCTAKKYEAQRPEMNSSGYQVVDAVLTTRELGRMLQHEGINFNLLKESDFDNPLGISSGAAAIFGVTAVLWKRPYARSMKWRPAKHCNSWNSLLCAGWKESKRLG